MSMENAIRKLLSMDEDEIRRIMKRAWKSYTELLSNIAHDIYKSCIQDFYSQYDPVKYKRHGYPEGKNLYQADAIEITESTLRIKTAAEQLWKYDGKTDKRSKVLSAVIAGYRGSNSRKVPAEWRAQWGKWKTTYPNDFSDYFQWDGLQDPTTMKEIMDYFVENVIEETKYIYWEILDELI